MSNFTTARKKRFFNAATSNRLPCYHVNKRILFLLINKSLVQKYRKCSSNFSISECYFLNLKKLRRGRGELLKSPKNKRGGEGGVQIFLIKMEGLVKQVGLFLKKGVPLIFILTNPFQCYLSLSVVCVFLFIYIISIGIICVSQEEPSLIASNQQMYDISTI